MSALLHDHDEAVAAIAARLKGHRGGPVHIDKGGVHHVVPLPDDRRFDAPPLDISGLDRVLSVDAAARLASAEPGVTFAALVRATMREGLVPVVVPELEGITVGGAVSGCSVESLSHRWGGFHDTCLEYEVVTGDGRVLACSRTRDPETFEMLHGSYGTLGILTAATFRLIPAQPFVHVTYEHFDDFRSFESALLDVCGAGNEDDPLFVDAIVHGPSGPERGSGPGRFVLCLGRFAHSAPYVSSYRGERVFYRSTRGRADDWLTTPDYLFRYDTECHWLTRGVPPLEWPWVRRLAGRWFLGSTNLIEWSGRLDRVLRMKRRPDVVCDVFLPADRFAEFYKWYEEDFDFFPLWVIPYRMPRPYPWVNPAHRTRMGGTDLFVDCAVYGRPNSHPAIDYSALIEDKTYELAGIKTLISRNHYSPERFWAIYDRVAYDAAKARLDPHGAFRRLDDKFTVKGGQPPT